MPRMQLVSEGAGKKLACGMRNYLPKNSSGLINIHELRWLRLRARPVENIIVKHRSCELGMLKMDNLLSGYLFIG